MTAAPLNILYLSTWFPQPPDNGAKLRAYYLLRALCRHHRVTLVAFAFATAQPDATDELTAACAALVPVWVDPFAANAIGTLRSFVAPQPDALRTQPIPAMQAAVRRAAAGRRFDVVIAAGEMMLPYALEVADVAPVILEEINSMTRWLRERYETAGGAVHRLRCWISWYKRRAFERRAYRQVKLVTMVSPEDHAATVATLGAGAGATPVALVPNGVDCAHNRPGLWPRRTHALVFNGSLTYSVNFAAMHWFLAEIYPRIRQAQPAVTLTITGALTGVALSALALEDSVRLTGHVADVRRPVAEAAVCVAPLQHGGGTRLKILEALALGTPVVATPKAAEGLALTDGTDVLLAADPPAFAAAVLRLLDDAALAQRLSAAGRALVTAHYDWAPIGDAFTALVEQTAGARSRP